MRHSLRSYSKEILLAKTKQFERRSGMSGCLEPYSKTSPLINLVTDLNEFLKIRISILLKSIG